MEISKRMSMDKYKCKLCGGTIEYSPGSRFGTCDCCGIVIELSLSGEGTSGGAKAAPAGAEPEVATNGDGTKRNSKETTGKKGRMVLAIVAAVAVIASLVLLLLPKQKDLASAKVGDTVHFGHYDDVDEWIVLDKTDDKLLLLRKYVISGQPYNDTFEYVTWQTCSLREWLNTEFLNAAFSFEELEMIDATYVKNADNPTYGTLGGYDTSDNVFLLSIEEALKYFPNNDERKATNLDGISGLWWLRTPGFNSYNAVYVGSDGSVYDYGYWVNDRFNFEVRPAVWIDLNPVPPRTLVTY